MNRNCSTLLIGILLSLISVSALAQITVLTPPGNSEHFGSSVAMHDGVAVVGDPWWSVESISIFDVATGDLLHEIANPDPDGWDGAQHYGSAVGVSDGYVVVGAPRTDTGVFDMRFNQAGRVYIHDQATGALLHRVDNPSPTLAEQFGTSIDVFGDKALIGAPMDGSSGRDGRAFIVDLASGDVLHQLDDPNPGPNRTNPDTIPRFGSTVSIDGNRAVVGSGSASYDRAGRVYVFRADSGALLQELPDPDPEIARFGQAVSLAGNTVLVGAAAYVHTFNASSGELIETFANPSPPGNGFGERLALADGVAVMGAPWDNDLGTFSGKVFIHHALTGNLLTTLINPSADSRSWDRYGLSVALENGFVLVGAPYDNQFGGIAYIHDLAESAEIDIVPFDAANQVFPASDSSIPVAVVSQSIATGDAIDLDATQTNSFSLRFGPGRAPPQSPVPHVTDVNNDGLSDAVYSFSTQASGIACNDTEATLRGNLQNGVFFTGTDSVDASDCETTCH